MLGGMRWCCFLSNFAPQSDHVRHREGRKHARSQVKRNLSQLKTYHQLLWNLPATLKPTGHLQAGKAKWHYLHFTKLTDVQWDWDHPLAWCVMVVIEVQTPRLLT